jgi:hypothetical protein
VPVDIEPVGSRQALREFIELPFRLHSTSPQWVPPLRLERHAYLSRRLNPFFKHGDARLFLARRDGRVVGRISAQVDDNFNAFHGSRWGNFGFLELEDDPEVMAALLAAAEGWLRERGMEKAVGPFDLTMNEEAGVLIEGFEHDPSIRYPWHPPYYQRLCEGAGLTKAVDLLSWYLDVGQRKNILPLMFDLDRKAREEHGIRIRHMTRRSLRRDLDAFQHVYNAAWSKNWGFVPISEAEMEQTAKDMKLIIDEDWLWVAETEEGETVGVALTIPDFNQAIEKANGRLLPFGWARILLQKPKIDRVRVGFLGVKPEYQHTGVAAAFYVEHFETASWKPQDGGEMGWILESNDAMNRGMEAMGGRVVKKYRLYERLFEG